MKLKTKLFIAFGTVFIVLAFLAGNRARTDRYFINIKDQHESHFINENDVKNMISEIGIQQPGLLRDDIDLKELERRLTSMEFISDAQVSRDLKGNLVVDIHQDKPIARLMTGGGNGGYITEKGELIPLSDKFTSRVVLLTGGGTAKLLEKDFLASEKGKEVLDFVKFVNEDELWNAQITQMDISDRLDIVAYPQVGKQVIEFGQAHGFKRKLGKLKIFYRQIVKNKGWNAYKKVKLQYGDQIVCQP